MDDILTFYDKNVNIKLEIIQFKKNEIYIF